MDQISCLSPGTSIITTLLASFFLLSYLVSPATYSATAASPSPSYYYDLCAPFPCGGINFTFPFSDSARFGSGPIDCGLPRYQISCDTSSPGGSPSLELSGRLYRVKSFSPDPEDRVITVSDAPLVNSLKAGSCESLRNLTVQVANLSLPQWRNLNLTFYLCSSGSSHPPEFLRMVVINRTCSEGGMLYLVVNPKSIEYGQTVTITTPTDCKLVLLPVSDAIVTSSKLLDNSSTSSGRWALLLEAVSSGFPLVWSQREECDNCVARGGRCGYDSETGNIACFCKNGCGQTTSNKRSALIGITSGISSLLLIVAVSVLIFRTKISLLPMNSYFAKDQPTKGRVDAENFIRTYRSTMINSYSYKDLKKMTSAFKEKLGEGGYGNVYKGTLPDGRLVAVKMLDKSNGEGRDFVNEVATIGRIHHLNIINLFGFCLEGPRQALVYEYMPNGSLGDLLRKKEPNVSLGMEKMLEIAIGVAHGIAYLHGGCESRILHLDIKPQNILLDDNLKPKISDFGLARVYSRHRTSVALTGPRGTFGFIAPEIFMRNLGNPSHRSDVYSFGMVLLEMVGGTTRQVEIMKASTSSSDVYFPEWIYDRLDKEKINAESSDAVVEEDSLVSRKMMMVGLWCIQVNPKDRPSMAMVVEMLNGSMDAIKMPPRPLFFSPPHPQFEEVQSFDDIESSSSLPLRHDSNDIHSFMRD